MSKYKIGDKVVLTVSNVNEKVYYPHYEFNNNFNLWEKSIDDYAEPLTTYIEQARITGQNEAWELARKITCQPINGGLKRSEFEEIFGYDYISDVFEKYTYQEAAAKVAEWEKTKEEVKIGDILEYIYDRSVKCVATNLYPSNMAYLVFEDGTAGMHELDDFKKTGRHIEIDSFLKQIKGEKK